MKAEEAFQEWDGTRKWCKRIMIFFAFLGGVWGSGWGTYKVARAFVKEVSAETMEPRVAKIETRAISNEEHWDKRFNTLEVGVFGKVVTPARVEDPKEGK